jgi:HEAT repeat protein
MVRERQSWRMRDLKSQILAILQSENFSERLEELRAFPGKQAVNPLFSFLLNRDEQVRWHAVSAMGIVISTLADEDLEAARVVMRRLMWSLNEESGGIGWGAPEVMAEAMCLHARIAEEFGSIFFSYADEGGNYLEYETLQRGLLWGIARCASVRPESARIVAPLLGNYLNSRDAVVRGYAVKAAGLLQATQFQALIECLGDDDALVPLYWDRRITIRRVNELAREALERLAEPKRADAPHDV